MEKHKGNIIAPLLLLLAFGIFPLCTYLYKKSKTPVGEYQGIVINDKLEDRIASVKPSCEWLKYEAKRCGMDIQTEGGKQFFLMLENDEQLDGLKGLDELFKPGTSIKKEIGSPRIQVADGQHNFDLLIDF